MLNLLLAVLSSSVIAILMRISSGRVQAGKTMLAVNYLICALLGAAYAGFDFPGPQVSGFGFTLGLSAVSGFLFLAGFVSQQVNIRKNGIVLSSIFMKLGLLVPFLLSVLVFRENPTLPQLTGFFLAIGAIVLINLKQDDTAAKPGPGLLLLLLLCGSCDATSKVFEAFGPQSLENQFLFLTFLVACLLCVGLVLRDRERPGMQDILFGVLIGVPNFFASKFLLGALGKLPAVVVFPTFSVGTLLIVTLAGVLAFREKLNRRQWIALGIILVALALLNL